MTGAQGECAIAAENAAQTPFCRNWPEANERQLLVIQRVAPPVIAAVNPVGSGVRPESVDGRTMAAAVGPAEPV